MLIKNVIYQQQKRTKVTKTSEEYTVPVASENIDHDISNALTVFRYRI